MRYRVIAVIAAAAVLGVVAARATASGQKATAHTLTVWLQVDAQNGWPDLVAAANNAFEKANPGWTVNVQYQQWTDHLQKFDATIAGSDTPGGHRDGEHRDDEIHGGRRVHEPDRLEVRQLGEVAHRHAGLGDLPREALRRPVLRRLARDHVSERPVQEGRLQRSRRRASSQFQSQLVKVGKMQKHVKGFAPMYVGGEDWYSALSFVFDYGGSIATFSHGKWHGTLNSKASIAGLTRFKQFFKATQSRSTATLDGSNPFPYTVYSQGRTAANYGPAWYTCCTGKKYAKGTKQFVMPSHVKGKAIPGFLGGSTLAIPSQSSSKAQAIEWLADFTSNASEQALEKKGNIPNATNLLGNSINERAAARSWFVPQAKHWVDVENGNILKTMLASILTGRLTVKQAATVASDNIAQTLNGK